MDLIEKYAKLRERLRGWPENAGDATGMSDAVVLMVEAANAIEVLEIGACQAADEITRLRSALAEAEAQRVRWRDLYHESMKMGLEQEDKARVALAEAESRVREECAKVLLLRSEVGDERECDLLRYMADRIRSLHPSEGG